ncbi:MAG: Xaa-Pro aminopeptidase [Verrucomicrobiales bacterium]|jgi:Xaa-Pro aminopeptidase
MKYRPIDFQLFVSNRKGLRESIRPKGLVILQANDILPTNADGTIRFRQNSDLFYLSGVDQEESILVLFPDAPDEKHREMLFVRETNDHIKVWEGAKLTKEQATEVSGIVEVHWLEEFPKLFRMLMIQAERVYLNSNEHPRADILMETRPARFVRECQAAFPLHRYERLAPIVSALRQIKQPIEIDLVKEACEITKKGFLRLLKFIKPGVGEWEIEAELAHEFMLNRSKDFAYQPIIASGGNACALHYLDNDQICQDGDVILLDVAAEYANYNSDLTRSIPVNGKFTPRQREVYDALLRVYRQAASWLKPGTIIKLYQEKVGKLMEGELIGLGMLDAEKVKDQDPDKPLYKKYFMHGTAHHIGLDVHDVGDVWRPMEPGMIFTCEPGIYIPDENLGLRVENDILITETGNIDLMESIPIEADEIEALMS